MLNPAPSSTHRANTHLCMKTTISCQSVMFGTVAQGRSARSTSPERPVASALIYPADFPNSDFIFCYISDAIIIDAEL